MSQTSAGASESYLATGHAIKGSTWLSKALAHSVIAPVIGCNDSSLYSVPTCVVTSGGPVCSLSSGSDPSLTSLASSKTLLFSIAALALGLVLQYGRVVAGRNGGLPLMIRRFGVSVFYVALYFTTF